MTRNQHDIVEDHFGVLDESQLPGSVGATVKVSSDDTTAGYLEDKIEAGSNIILSVNNDGGNETLEIASTGGGGGGGIGTTSSSIGDECFFSSTGFVYEGAITQIVSGTGATTSNQSAPVGHQGVIGLSTGTATTGRCALSAINGASTSIALAGGAVRVGTVMKILNLSDGTNTFTVRMGLGGDLYSGDALTGIFFRYTNGTNSGKWEARSIVTGGGGSATTNDTGITADTNWHSYEFEVNAAATSIEFFIDGSSVSTISTVASIPAINLFLTPLSIVKSAGGTARLVHIDAWWANFTFSGR